MSVVEKILPDQSNPLFMLAAELINQGSRDVFVTGKAGTGKTTFLKYVREHSARQMAIVAPTGVAAINAGGVTIHSLFQLPLAPYVPGSTSSVADSPNDQQAPVNKHALISRARLTKEKLELFQKLELLVIDEVSMVRADMLDAIDVILRHARSQPEKRFGGVQLLLIGDLYQLPPVAREDAWKILSVYYDSPYFFDSHVMKEQPPLCIEFEKIYRQSEEDFIRLLNQIRNNNLDAQSRLLLETRFQPEFRAPKDEGYIILTTHNERAREINARELNLLPGPGFSFAAAVDGEFAENAFPADQSLQLRKGAQVMFLRNDPDKARRYYNGKIGTVTGLQHDSIQVRCNDDGLIIDVKKEKWENIRYAVNGETSKMEESRLGSFTQYPLRHAWAITIHKSQGLTFNRAIIDAGRSFAPGQTYVALSRCTNLEGMILQSRISAESLATDPRVVAFMQTVATVDTLQQEAGESRREYQQEILLQLFSARPLLSLYQELHQTVHKHKKSFNPPTLDWLEQIRGPLQQLASVGERFNDWMKSQFAPGVPPAKIPSLSDRVEKGIDHFVQQFDHLMITIISYPARTDSRLHAREAGERIQAIYTAIGEHRHQLLSMKGLPSPGEWHQRKSEFQPIPLQLTLYSGADASAGLQTQHPELHSRLRRLRDELCTKLDQPIYMVASAASLEEMVQQLPVTAETLRQVKGFGEAKVKRFGDEFIRVIRDYCDEMNIDPSLRVREAGTKNATKRTKKEPSEKKKSSKTKEAGGSGKESFRLFREGMTIAQIAEVRNLANSTVESHLEPFVVSGEIPVEVFVPQPKLTRILDAIAGAGEAFRLSAIREQLGNDVSFADIKFAAASLRKDPS